MVKRPNKREQIIEGLEIIDMAAEGKSIGKHEGKVIFVPFTIPGDVVDVKVRKSRKSFAEGSIIQYLKKSDKRKEPVCIHFGTCGGCKWQNLPYYDQLKFKENQVRDQFQRIGKIEVMEYLPILGSAREYEYRNKLEYTFSNKRWLTSEEIQSSEEIDDIEGLGFHIPGRFDKVLDIHECHLMDRRHNEIRNTIKAYALENRSEEHTSELQSQSNLVCRLLLEKKK